MMCFWIQCWNWYINLKGLRQEGWVQWYTGLDSYNYWYLILAPHAHFIVSFFTSCHLRGTTSSEAPLTISPNDAIPFLCNGLRQRLSVNYFSYFDLLVPSFQQIEIHTKWLFSFNSSAMNTDSLHFWANIFIELEIKEEIENCVVLGLTISLGLTDLCK